MFPLKAAGRPIIWAHRGGAWGAPENTIAAFDRGLAVGADGIELDVRECGEGTTSPSEMVVHHDSRLGRTSNGSGRVDSCSLEELQQFDAGFHFGPDEGHFPFRGQGLRIPTLREVLDRYPECLVTIELKTRRSAIRAADIVRAAGAVDRVIVGSYFDRTLARLRAYAPDIATSAGYAEVKAALMRSWAGLGPGRVPYTCFQVPECTTWLRIVSPRFVRTAHRAGLPVHVWTVNDPDDMRRLLAWGVDGIITDRPDLALAIAGRVANETGIERL